MRKTRLPALVLFFALAFCGAPDDGELPPLEDMGQVSHCLDPMLVTLRPEKAQELCWTVDGDQAKDQALIVLAPCEDKASQLWYRYGGQLRVLGEHCLSVADTQATDGARLELWPCQPTNPAQKFVFSDNGFQYGDGGSHCVDVPDGKFAAGTPLQLWTCQAGHENQAFGFLPSDHQTESQPAVVVAKPKQIPLATPAKDDKKPQAKPAAAKPEPAPVAPAPKTSAAPAGTLVAPYFYAWERSAGFAATLMDVQKKAGLKAATLAFALSGGGCKIAQFDHMAADIKNFQAAGGKVVLSVGGASGTYPQATCKDPKQLAAALLAMAKAYNTAFIDHDVEGTQLGDDAANQRLVDALGIALKSAPGLQLSFTLPVGFDGLPKEALALLEKLAKMSPAAPPGMVNIMAMDYGAHPPGGKDAGDAAIMAADATAAQMIELWPKVNRPDIYKKIGVTPMLGQNDGSADLPFLPADAKKVAAYAKKVGLGRIAWWAVQRDLAAKGDYNDHSNNQTADYEYLKAFQGG